ncbi:MAG: hypothetical protein ACOX6I_06770 [Syntrophomonadaceae bacterium]
MKRFVDKVEKALVRIVVLGLVLMVMVQALMTREQYRLFLSWGEQLEGQSINFPVNSTQMDITEPEPVIKNSSSEMSISIVGYSSLPKSIIMVNGYKVGNFADPTISFTINDGDVIEIDSRYYNFPIDYKITGISDNVSYPVKGREYTGNQSIVMVGKVQIE